MRPLVVSKSSLCPKVEKFVNGVWWKGILDAGGPIGERRATTGLLPRPLTEVSKPSRNPAERNSKMNQIISRLTATTLALNKAQEKTALGSPEYSDIVQIEIAKSLALIADELQAIRTSMPRK
jgi:hypothetical protein